MASKKAFTLIELMIVIGIIGILSSVVLVGLGGARQNSRDKAAFMQISSIQPLAYKCIKTDLSDVRISNPNNPTSYPIATGDTNPVICFNGTGSANRVGGFPQWPELQAGSGFLYSSFRYCNVNSSITSSDPGSCLGYAEGSCGSSRDAGKFCYRFTNGTKVIWCTQDGCAKSGF